MINTIRIILKVTGFISLALLVSIYLISIIGRFYNKIDEKFDSFANKLNPAILAIIVYWWIIALLLNLILKLF